MLAHLLIHMLGQSISRKAKGCVVKRVVCEHCHEEYIYQLRRSVTASDYAFLHIGVAQKIQKATEKAQDKVRKALEKGVDAVGCPMCGWLQADMVRERQQRIFKTLGCVDLVAAFVILLVWIVSGTLEISESAILGAIAITVCVTVLTIAYVLLTDVNRSAYRRTREVLGTRCRAMLSAEFDALLAETPA